MNARIIVAALLGLMLAGCQTSEPTMQMGPDAEVTFDGLHRVDGTLMSRVWARPGIDLSQYDKILPVSAGIQYRSVDERNRYKRNASEFPISEADKDRIETAITEVFARELQKIKHFTATDQPGPGVLKLEIGLADVVSFVPPQQGVRDRFYVSNLGEAMLVMQLSDSQSEEMLARVADRRAVEPLVVQEANRVTSIAEVKRSFSVWPQRIASGLDELHELGCFQCEEDE